MTKEFELKNKQIQELERKVTKLNVELTTCQKLVSKIKALELDESA